MTRRGFCVLMLGPPLRAQLAKDAGPPPGLQAKLRPAPKYDLGALPPQQRTGGDKSQLDAIGKHRPLPPSALGKGKWDKLPDGRKVWRLAIQSTAAVGLRIHFEKFDVGAGSVWLYDADARICGPYSGKGRDGTGSFWSDTVFAAIATVEYLPAKDKPSKGAPPFQIGEITHLFS
ncbi:MAG: hypothetical protein HYZ37_17995 [Candidatus Solibacter usitatus]|nr:hypothetical protein [Candidatus Solibacter usitatus]